MLGALAPRSTVLHWHGETFDVPPGAAVLARSRHTSCQAFRAGSSAWGLLFHAEADARLVDRWLDEPAMAAEALEVLGPEAGNQLRRDVGRARGTLLDASASMFRAFASLSDDAAQRDRVADQRTSDVPAVRVEPVSDFSQMPPDLPVPQDDGAARHLTTYRLPRLRLPSTDGTEVSLGELGPGRTVIYFYPLTGRPGHNLPEGWDSIPGARGCTPQACGFRDDFAELSAAGAARLFGVSSQELTYQRELVERLHLPFPMLSDPELQLAATLSLPTFKAAGQTLYKRLTMIVTDGSIEHVFYPVFPPGQHAKQVLDWLRRHA